MKHYIALIHKEKTSDYGVSFPDFPGCVTAGRTLDEAKTMAHEALSNHLKILKELNKKIPSPSNLDKIMSDSYNKKAVAFLVDVASHKSLRVNVTFPEDVLNIIDRKAEKHHMTRSSFLAYVALQFEGANQKNLKK
jgi:predicted RNase H-like HicB family nuclease